MVFYTKKENANTRNIYNRNLTTMTEHIKQQIDYTGRIFGRLMVVSIHERIIGKRPKWKCLCSCGNTTIVQSNNLHSGHTTSCGCFHKECIIKANSVDYTKDVYPEWNNTGIGVRQYNSLHAWVRNNYGNATYCSFCGKDGRKYEWALKKGCKYEKKIENFMQLCKHCHKNYDLTESTKRKISESHKGKRNTAIHVPIIQYDKKGNKICEYECIRDAAKQLHILQSAIGNNLRGSSKTCNSFIFKYKNKQHAA